MASTSTCSSSKILHTQYTTSELEVAEILIELPQLFQNYKSIQFKLKLQLLLGWGSKRKRSSIVTNKSLSSSPTSASPFNTDFNNDHEKKTKVKVHASSPDTPLSFSPSESDSKSKLSRPKRRSLNKNTGKKKKKKTYKQLKETVAILSSEQDLLNNEVAKAKAYYDKLRAENLRLKYRQLELGLLRKSNQIELNSYERLVVFEEPTKQPNPVFQGKGASIFLQPSDQRYEEKKAPTIHQPSELTVANTTTVIGNFGLPYVKMPLLSESSLCLQSKHQPYRVVDMNFFADEAANRDCKAAIAAQARKRRIEIKRSKSSTAFKQPRLK